MDDQRESTGDPRERLPNATWGGVAFVAEVEDVEAVTEQSHQVLGPVASNGEPGAVVGSVESECGDDDVPARTNRTMQQAQVSVPILWLHEEVEDRPVVPQVVAAIGLPGQQVPLDPLRGRR